MRGNHRAERINSWREVGLGAQSSARALVKHAGLCPRISWPPGPARRREDRGVDGPAGPLARPGPLRVSLSGVEWHVGVLRSGAENVAWTDRGEAPDWEAARLEVIAALRELVAAQGRQEYRVRIDGQDGS